MPEKVTLSDDEWSTWRAFLDMRRRLDVTLERQLQHDADITIAEFSVLSTLFEAPDKELRIGELGAALAWEKSRVSHQVSRMEKRGLVKRRLCTTDARGTWVGLTADGSRSVLGAMRPHTAALRQYFFDVLSPEQLAAVESASTALLAVLQPCTVEDVEAEPDATAAVRDAPAPAAPTAAAPAGAPALASA